nr:MAG TPA: hypothetical protein [Caudoviricetes sp.]
MLRRWVAIVTHCLFYLCLTRSQPTLLDVWGRRL